MAGPKGRPWPLKLYGGLTRLAAPLAPVILDHRAKRGKEDPARRAERLKGVGAIARPEGPLVWLHAASVGETIMVLPLIRKLTERGFAVLLTTVTVTSAKVAAERLPQGAIHQFVPLDIPGAVARFLDHWRPGLALFVEKELWPNLIEATHDRGVPLALVNARLSPRSAERYAKAPAMFRHMLARFDLVLAQGAADRDLLKGFRAAEIQAVGSLKFDAPPPVVPVEELARLNAALAGRPRWVAASTQEGDEAIVISAHRVALARTPDAALLIAPRHPPRADAVEAELVAAGLTVARRTRGEWPAGRDVFLLDTIGEMGLIYGAGGPAYIGKTLVPPGGGQNPIEPAKLGLPVLHGPLTANFGDIFGDIDAGGGGVLVRDADELGMEIGRLLADPAAAREMGERARAVVDTHTGALDRTMAALEPYLKRLEGAR